jgi:transposase-like protein
MSKPKSLEELFAGHHVGREVIILCVRWYLRYKLSLRDLVEIMAERGLALAHTTILRWVRRLRTFYRFVDTLEENSLSNGFINFPYCHSIHPTSARPIKPLP